MVVDLDPLDPPDRCDSDPPATVSGKFTTDPTKSPAAIDMTTTDGPAAGDRSEGIFELNGDTLKLAFAVKTAPDPVRPERFGGAGVIVLVLKRKK